MLPVVVADELQKSIKGFLRGAFPTTTAYFQQGREGASAYQLIDDLVERPGALFKGPYLQLKLPFRKAKEGQLPFRHIDLGFAPYLHQQRAFLRLTGDKPKSTLVATGTGSGKTECFMMPVLDDCLERRQRGIKTLVIYPMNALATDQAKRFAEEINKLDTRLTVGLFVGGEQKQADKVMGPENVITDQETLRDNPPDILLTNYKMLDFLLIRPKDQPLWRYNSPGMLRYLIVDELHTFDGAQGTDLACLIRRLRDRLEIGNELACVGTSATLGGGDTSKDRLLSYASEVFAAPFEPDSLIGEDRLTAEEYLQSNAGEASPAQHFNWPLDQIEELDSDAYRDANDYLFHQARLWFSDLPAAQLPPLNAPHKTQRQQAAVDLGQLLRSHVAFHELVYATATLVDGDALAASWQQTMRLPKLADAKLLLSSLMSLVSAARLKQDMGISIKYRPFLQLSTQLWLRELRRMVCSLPQGEEEPPHLLFADDLQDASHPLHLPLLHCRECHLAAWGALAKDDGHFLEGDLKQFYQAWFAHQTRSRVVVPLTKHEAQQRNQLVQAFCAACGRLQRWKDSHSGCCDCDNEALIPVWLPDIISKTTQTPQAQHHCPGCGSRNGLMILGYRAATLTSVMVSRLFATPYNDDYKLIAFSDSVQDAAHRAGFLGANTWRQVMRQAIVGWLKQQSRPLSLADMAEILPTYWRQYWGNDEAFCGVFVPHSLKDDWDYDRLVSTGTLPANSLLPESIIKRLSWECVAEFGHRSQIGRSLERSGYASIAFDIDQLTTRLEPLLSRLREEVESLGQLSGDELLRFVVGWIHHLRHIGAIYHEALSSYLTNQGNTFLLNRLRWMPNFGGGKRPPAAISLESLANNFEAILLSRRTSWSAHWLNKTLGQDNVMVSAEVRQVFQLLVQHLTQAGWLVEKSCKGQSIYLLNPACLMVTQDTCRAECSQCHQSVYLGANVSALYEGIACLRSNCIGHLEIKGVPLQTRDYGLVAPRRLVPGEHTGLLAREVRQKVEHSFIKGYDSWDINLLSATPTLEMGIDIGALSSVFLCSVPPAQSNYLQRIGRAGRRDGNALAVTLANGRNHDLYFYADPLEMMAGDVQTPGVFLQARAVLERQLMAYCLGNWVVAGEDVAVLPGQMRKLLDNVEQQKTALFPHNFIAYLESHQESLSASFCALFKRLDAEAKAYLSAQLAGTAAGTKNGAGKSDSLGIRLVARLQEMVDERADFKRQIGQLKRVKDKLEAGPDDESTREEIAEVERERSALQALLRQLNDQLVLNFLTDEGILPNYAFPEEGVTLQSVILRRLGKTQTTEEGKHYTKTSYSFQRPAQAALGELAPDSHFFAVSHKLPIDRVDLKRSSPEYWRFCDRCQYHQKIDSTQSDRHSACPRCGSPQWADKGQKQSVLRLRQVYSTVDDGDSRIGDDAENRQPIFFNRKMLVDVPPGTQTQSFTLDSDELPFGFEYLPRATFREVNFGAMSEAGQVFAVAGDEKPRIGFQICRYCGMVQKEQPSTVKRQHAYNCPLRQNESEPTVDDFYQSLYLYRELNSEAIRILLPLSEVAYSDEGLHSFIAALNLGLREYFHGDVHHLQVTEMREPANAESGERVYLIVYDRIPGGTGYLKELMANPANIMQVLELTHRRLSECDCADDPDKDGCYQCILAYRDSRNMATISRRHATDLIGNILELKDNLKQVDGLSQISTNSLIESELEQRFMDALAALPTARLNRQLVNGKLGSVLTLDGADGRPVAWYVEHQIQLGEADGVALNTRIDMLLTPVRSEDAEQVRPIVVYVDGLQYHHDKAGDDVCKRMALLLSRQYHVFSLNWDDLPLASDPMKPCDPDLVRLPGASDNKMKPLYDKVATQADWLKANECALDLKNGSFRWLETILRQPKRLNTHFPQMAFYRGLTSLIPELSKQEALSQAFHEAVKVRVPATLQPCFHNGKEQVLLGGFVGADSPRRLFMASGLPMAATREGNDVLLEAMHVFLCFDDSELTLSDDFKSAWRAFWKAANLLQFLPNFTMATSSVVENGRWQGVQSKADQLKEATPSDSLHDASWNDVFELSILPSDALEKLKALEVPVPQVGDDLLAANGRIALSGDEVELSWPDIKLAVINCSDNKQAELLQDWQLISVEGDWLAVLKTMQQNGEL